jgi:predicted nucleic acid-binding protein
VVVLLDSAVVAGFLDRDDAFHAAADARMRQLAGRDQIIVSVITYAELLTGAGVGHHAETAVHGFFAKLVDEIHDVDRAVAERAAQLRIAKASLRMPDALILATADVHEAAVIITAERRWVDAPTDRRVELLEPA